MNYYQRKKAILIPECAFAKSMDTVVYWLAGTGFLLHSRKINILIDPVLCTNHKDSTISEIGFKMKTQYPISANAIPNGTYIFYTHTDKDHLGPETAGILARKQVKFIGTLKVFERLARLGVKPEKIEILRIFEKMKINDIIVESVIADHPWQLKALERDGRPFRIGECSGFIFNTADGRVYFPGDTRLMEQHMEIPDVDLLALDVSTDVYHLGHESAVVLGNHFERADIVPFHYGTYDVPNVEAWIGDPEEVYNDIKDHEIRCHILAPGEPFKVMRH